MSRSYTGWAHKSVSGEILAVYTIINDTELESFLAKYDFGQLLHYGGITEGVENSNYLLLTQSGRYILTIYEI